MSDYIGLGIYVGGRPTMCPGRWVGGICLLVVIVVVSLSVF